MYQPAHRSVFKYTKLHPIFNTSSITNSQLWPAPHQINIFDFHFVSWNPFIWFFFQLFIKHCGPLIDSIDSGSRIVWNWGANVKFRIQWDIINYIISGSTYVCWCSFVYFFFHWSIYFDWSLASFALIQIFQFK